ncbi:MAG: Panacea domain-containing protein [Pyrinomonadaceae bacterium]
MDKDTLPLQLRTRYIAGLTQNIQAYFEKEDGVKYSAEVVNNALETWLESRFDRMLEQLGEVITSPHLAESRDFRRILEERMEGAPQRATTAAAFGAAVATVATDATIFTGARSYSPEKLGAMIEYIAERGRDIYKTNLNKLLFYSDLTHYYMYGHGISGATYVNLPYGPVPETVETVIDDLAAANRISKVDVPDRGTNAQMIKPAKGSPVSLDDEEKQLIDWVLDTYGDMTPGQITDFSHAEKAYKFTRPQEPIAYEYAKFFEKLPSKE